MHIWCESAKFHDSYWWHIRYLTMNRSIKMLVYILPHKKAFQIRFLRYAGMTSSEILRTSLLLSFLDDCIPAAHHALLKASTARTGSSLNLGWCKHPDQHQELVLPSTPAQINSKNWFFPQTRLAPAPRSSTLLLHTADRWQYILQHSCWMVQKSPLWRHWVDAMDFCCLCDLMMMILNRVLRGTFYE